MNASISKFVIFGSIDTFAGFMRKVLTWVFAFQMGKKAANEEQNAAVWGPWQKLNQP
jgi:hypothetical protein